jgi:putative addiction module component (TIGR02574 family)
MVSDLLALPLGERLSLVQSLWDSIAAERIGPSLSDDDLQLTAERLERFEADGHPGTDAQSVLSALEDSL